MGMVESNQTGISSKGISVIITIDRQKSTDLDTLLSTFFQSNTIKSYELLILDQTGSDDIKIVIAKHAPQGFIRHLRVSDPSLLTPEFFRSKARYSKIVHISKLDDVHELTSGKQISQPSALYDKTILYIIHDGGGGMVHTSFDLMKSVGRYAYAFLLKAGRKKWEIFSTENGNFFRKDIYNFKTDWKNINDLDQERKGALEDIFNEINPDLIHFRVLLGTGPSAIDFFKTKNLPVVFSFHEYSAVCPNLHLMNNGYFCYGACQKQKNQNDCHYPKSWFGQKQLRGAYRYIWAEQVNKFLHKCDAYIVTSDITKKIVLKNYPALSPEKFYRIEHGRDFDQRYTFYKEYNKGDFCNLIFFGALNEQKGCSLILDLVTINEKKNGPLVFHVAGNIFSSEYKECFSQYKSVVLHGDYKRDDLTHILKLINPTLALLPSICLETYSHTLTEAWAHGIPVLGTSYGAIGERIRENRGGWVLEPVDAQKWYDKIVEIIENFCNYHRALF